MEGFWMIIIVITVFSPFLVIFMGLSPPYCYQDHYADDLTRCAMNCGRKLCSHDACGKDIGQLSHSVRRLIYLRQNCLHAYDRICYPCLLKTQELKETT